MNFTNFTFELLNQTTKIDSYTELVRLNCASWSSSLFKYGILLVIAGLTLKLVLDMDLLKNHPQIKDFILFICYLVIVLIGVILISMSFL